MNLIGKLGRINRPFSPARGIMNTRVGKRAFVSCVLMINVGGKQLRGRGWRFDGSLFVAKFCVLAWRCREILL